MRALTIILIFLMSFNVMSENLRNENQIFCTPLNSEEIIENSFSHDIHKISNYVVNISNGIDKLGKDIEPPYKLKEIIYTPTSLTSNSLKYDLGYKRLKPKECLYLKVPEQLQNKPVLFVNLGHTQTDSDNTGYDHEKKWDNNPGLTSVQLNETNGNNEAKWRYWNGMSSGDFGAKFAEPGHMELEGLYEWYKHGHKDIKTHTVSYEPLHTNGIRLCSTGKDPVTIGSLEVKFAPDPADEYVEFNISSSNNMGDPLTAKERSYGSTSDAIKLGGYGSSISTELPKGLKSNGGNLEYELKPGTEVSSFEISVSDKHENGDSGWAKLDVKIQKKDGSSINIIQNENVPPEGVILGVPEKAYSTQPGDKIVIRSRNDQTYIMGLRVGLKK